jgi:hypothetical protein
VHLMIITQPNAVQALATPLTSAGRSMVVIRFTL